MAIFLDLAKAFDTVSHEKLLNKLNKYGCRGVCGDLLRDYLANRRQRVSINSELSDEKTVKYGIPQGTVIGPILFQIYINDMLKLKIPGQVISYADDTVLLFSGADWDEVKLKAEMGLHIIHKWLNINLLTLNKTKTKFMTFSLNTAGSSNITKLKLHECQNLDDCNNCNYSIEHTKALKYLGLYIDQFLKWDVHIGTLSDKLRRLIFKFYQLRQFMETLLIIYKALLKV